MLTTKNGHVKLADFGVATKLASKDANDVVGTPYWSGLAGGLTSIPGAVILMNRDVHGFFLKL